MMKDMLNEVLLYAYINSRVHCAQGCLYIFLTLFFCILRFGLTLGVSTLQILFYITWCVQSLNSKHKQLQESTISQYQYVHFTHPKRTKRIPSQRSTRQQPKLHNKVSPNSASEKTYFLQINKSYLEVFFLLCPSVFINPFTAMFAAMSLGKRPTEVPNLKPVKQFLPPSREHVKGFLSKCTVLKVDLLQDHQIYCLQACVCVHFSTWRFHRLGQWRG